MNDIQKLHNQVDAINRRIGDLRLLSFDKRQERIQLTTEHYPDIVQELKVIREKLNDALLEPLTQSQRQYFEDYLEVIGWILPEKKKQQPTNQPQQASNLSLYPNMQAHIQHKLK